MNDNDKKILINYFKNNISYIDKDMDIGTYDTKIMVDELEIKFLKSNQNFFIEINIAISNKKNISTN